MTSTDSIFKALQAFAAAVTEKMSQLTPGEPEEQLRTPFENFMQKEVSEALGWKIICNGETPLPDRLGRPDFAIKRNQALVGYVELKAPGSGANAKRFKGRNREQFRRFSAMPNMLYTDGNEWALYRNGELAGKIVQLSGDVSTDGASAVAAEDAANVERLLRGFLQWEPFIPTGRKGKIDLKGFADLLAPLTRMLRDDVTDALKDAESPLVHLARDWRQLLFPGAPDEQFADAYAQTVAFALLLGRSEGADPLTLDSAEAALAAQHNLLSRALQVLTDPGARAEMKASLNLLLRLIAAVPPATFTGPEDPWLYFYEEFLAAYDPKLRKDAGAYYTPVEVVRCQVRLIDDLLVNHLNMPLGFADPGVITLDPATGTGTYLLGVIEHALKRIEAEQGAGAVAGQASELARNLYGFELMVGPYAVAELRVSRALRDRGALLPKDGTHVYLTDTLESPDAKPLSLSFYLKPISDQHEKALKVKNSVPVIVCLGNPPYDRHEAATGMNKARTGNWVRWGDKPNGADAIIHDFIDPAVAAGHGVHVKNLYNLYVYFWRWALWKVFEHPAAHGPGIVSFITGSSYLDGDAFCGMREHMRRHCDEIWILDLGGEGRGTRQDDNVFAIQTPVAIAVAVRSSKAREDKPATVRYARIEGARNAKLASLDAIANFASITWQECPDDWQTPFRPQGKGDYFTWPLLIDIMPWQHSGVQLKRTWPIGPDKETLEKRWRGLLTAPNRSEAFRCTGDREINGTYRVELTNETDATPIASLPSNSPVPTIQRYAYRSFDRHCIIADGRLMSRPRPDLWLAHSERQVYLSSLFSQALGSGPALTVSAIIPDLDHFRGSYGAKAAIPLFRTANASEANILPGLLDLLGATYRRTVTPEDFLAYVYGVLAQPAFTARFHKELETRELRVPVTKEGELFEQARGIGAKLLWLHTYGERYVPDGRKRGQVPNGSARCTKAVPGDADSYPETFEYNDATLALRVGDGQFAPVAPEVFAFEVSGLKVVQSWLKYRMKKGAGKKSSPLDDIRPERWTSQFTTELLELLWVLEATIDSYPEQAALLETILVSDCFSASELPAVPEHMRSPKKAKPTTGDLFDFEE